MRSKSLTPLLAQLHNRILKSHRESTGVVHRRTIYHFQAKRILMSSTCFTITDVAEKTLSFKTSKTIKPQHDKSLKKHNPRNSTKRKKTFRKGSECLSIKLHTTPETYKDPIEIASLLVLMF